MTEEEEKTVPEESVVADAITDVVAAEQMAEVTVETEVTAEVTVETEVTAEVTVEPEVTAEVTVETEVTAEVTVESEVTAEVTVESEVAAEVAAVEPAAQAEPLKLEGNKPKVPHVPLPSSLQEIVGALLFASESPLTANDLRTCIRGVAPEEGEDAEIMCVYQSCTSREIEQALHGLEKELERSGCGFRLVCTGGTYRMQTVPTCGRYVRALLKLDRPNRLSRAALETLAIIAYRQPITKAEIEQIRGVAVDTIVKSLVDLQLVRLVGRSELPGHPFLYGTSPAFLEHFGLSSLSELNEIDPTLQRSNPRERAKLFVKEKKVEEKPAEEKSALENKSEEKTAGEKPKQETSEPENVAVPEDVENFDSEDEVKEGTRRVSFRADDDDEPLVDDDEPLVDDDEPLVDDDEPLVDDDEPLVDDDEPLVDDDEPLVDDDEPLVDDDEPLVDDDDDEPLVDDESEDEFDEEDEEGEDDDDE